MAAVADGRSPVRVELDRAVVIGQGLLVPAHELVGLAAAADRPGIVRVKLYRAAEIGQRLPVLAHFLADQAATPDRPGIVRVKLYRVIEIGQRLRVPAHVPEDDAAAADDPGIVRVKLDDAAEIGQRLPVAPHETVGAPPAPESWKDSRIPVDDPVVICDRVLVPASACVLRSAFSERNKQRRWFEVGVGDEAGKISGQVRTLDAIKEALAPFPESRLVGVAAGISENFPPLACVRRASFGGVGRQGQHPRPIAARIGAQQVVCLLSRVGCPWRI